MGAQCLLAAANESDRHGKVLWTGLAKLVSGCYNSTALVGTADQVSDALLDYYNLGIDSVLIRGFDPLNDAVEYSRELLPLTREKWLRKRAAKGAPNAPGRPVCRNNPSVEP